MHTLVMVGILKECNIGLALFSLKIKTAADFSGGRVSSTVSNLQNSTPNLFSTTSPFKTGQLDEIKVQELH